MTTDPRPDTPHVPFGSTSRRVVTGDLQRAPLFIGNVNPGDVSSGFADSLAQLAAADLAAGWGCYVGKIAHQSRANISLSRNNVVADFLTTNGEWLLLVDSDSVFPADTHVRLMSAAAATGATIIGGLCVMVDTEGVVPTLYQRHPDAVTRLQLDYPDDTVLQVYATGAACLLVHRSVFEDIKAARAEATYPWFAEVEVNGRWVSEDIEFCRRAGDAGHQIYVDCGLKIGHQKYGRVWSADDIRSNNSMTRRPLVVAIPTKQQPGLCRALVDQLLEQGEATEIVVIDNGMPIAPRVAFDELPVTVLDAPDVGINAMWNRAVEHAIEHHGRAAHVALLNDDLRIGPGFLGALSRALESDPKLAAVSGNYDGRRHPGLVQVVRDICAGRMDGTGGFAGFAFMVKAGWFTGGYRFPEQCMWWFGDNDLVMAVNEVGGRVGIALGAEVEHLGGGGQSAGDVAWTDHRDQTTKDQAAFEERWRILHAQRDRIVRAVEAAWAHKPTEGAPVCVITVNFGHHDTITPLPAQDLDCDAILLSDRPIDVPGWRTVVVDQADDMTPRLAAKGPRCRPDRYTDADVVVWLDAHVTVTSGSLIRELVDELGDGEIGAFRHGFHQSITEEAQLASTMAKYEGYDLVAQADHYLGQGHPDDWGMWTTGIMVRRPAATIDFGDEWLVEIQQWGPEDQISLPVVLRRCGITPVDLAFEGWWAGHRFTLHPHNDGTM